MTRLLFILKWTFVSVVVGLTSSLLIIGFVFGIDKIWSFLVNFGSSQSPPAIIYFSPAIAGLIVGWIIYKVDEDCAGSGVRGTLKYIVGGSIPKLITVPLKLIATVLTLGSGGSGGIDGPALQMGYGLGNYFTYIFRFSYSEAPNIIRVCGASAALGALLQSPIGAAVFVLEAFRRRLLDYYYLVPAIIANTTGYILSLYLLPRHAVFGTPDFVPSAWLLFLSIIVGILTAFVCIAFMRSFKRMYTGFLNLSVPLWLKPVIGGAIVGGLGFLLINLLRVPPDSVMSDCIYPLYYVIDIKFSFFILLAILIGRIGTTLFTVTSRNSAGIITPTMFIGALVGAAMSTVFGLSPTPLAIAGIAAGLSAVFNAPLAAILIVTEMSGLNYAAPAAIAGFVAYVMARGENILSYEGYVSAEEWI